MHTVTVEIFSDQGNAAVVRHPGRKFPGVLVQGDSLFVLCRQADVACAAVRSVLDSDRYEELDDLRNKLWNYLNHYKAVLQEHQLPLPFSDSASV